jgi:hypothetical protein
MKAAERVSRRGILWSACSAIIFFFTVMIPSYSQTKHYDWGDAPDPSYPTYANHNGARHVWSPNTCLGTAIDYENDGQPSASADGDDTLGSDDEDGVFFTSALTAGSAASVSVVASVSGVLNAWIDFNRDGDWNDSGEKIFSEKVLSAGTNALVFSVPAGASAGYTFGRFRFSLKGGQNITGEAPDGEVEDYRITLKEAEKPETDFGDAPDPPYPTLLASDGARHQISGGLFLGSSVDGENDGSPDPQALGDNRSGQPNDEDGVTVATPLRRGKSGQVTVVASADGILNAWIDFNGNGSWGDREDWVIQNRVLSQGSHTLDVFVPFNASVDTAFARFRISNTVDLGYTGSAPDGEDEDYRIPIPKDGMEWDYGDAPAVHGTLLADRGPRHLVNPDVRLGRLIDSELDGQPSIWGAKGDDNWGVDDEDGVVFMNPPVVGQNTTIRVEASCAGYINAWIDWNSNSAWSAVEHILADRPVTAGYNTFSVPVPLSARTSPTFARFRFTTAPRIDFLGDAADGEVEDYIVEIFAEVPPMDFGDAPAPYPTTRAMDGARHVVGEDITWRAHLAGLNIGGWQLIADTETDGFPDDAALGDDRNDTSGLSVGSNDEHGVEFPELGLVPGNYSVFVVYPKDTAYLNVWIDFNRDGDWSDPEEHVIVDTLLYADVGKTYNLTFMTPAFANEGPSFARFRVSKIQGLSYYGPAPDGEVEDHAITILPRPTDASLDFGDAPESYPTLLAENGACHAITGLRLGINIDGEPDARRTPPGSSSGDRYDDGILHQDYLHQGLPAIIKVAPSGEAFLNAWMDFNQNGSWDDPGEQIFTNTYVHPVDFPEDDYCPDYNDYLSFMVPPDSREGWTWARFRLSTQRDLTPFGYAMDGEVEDRPFSILSGLTRVLLDFGDAPAPYPTRTSDLGAYGIIGLIPLDHGFIGPLVDHESDGQPDPLALGDDHSGVDDEDGIIEMTELVPGESARIRILVDDYSFKQVWIDFNQDGDWNDPGEALRSRNDFTDRFLDVFDFVVPASARPGTTFARFIYGSWPGIPIGECGQGEVEDHAVTILPPHLSVRDVFGREGLGTITIPFSPGSGSGFPTDGFGWPAGGGPLGKNAATGSSIIMIKDGAGRVFIPEYGIDQIDTLFSGRGYQFFMSRDDTFKVNGLPLDPTLPMPVPGSYEDFQTGGWDLVPFLPNSPVPVDQAFASIRENILCVRNSDGQIYMPRMGINQIGMMRPGECYWVSLEKPDTLIYPDGSLGKARTRTDSTHFSCTRYTGGSTVIVIPVDAKPMMLGGVPLDNGDEIGVFNKAGLCCGGGVWEEKNLAFTVWADNPMTEAVDGLLPCDTLYFRMWDRNKEEECRAVVALEDPNLIRYQSDGLVVLAGLKGVPASGVGGDKNRPVRYMLEQNYPNPFNPATDIRFAMAQPGNATVTVYDILGRQVYRWEKRNLPAGFHSIRWEGTDQEGRTVATGLYICRFEARKSRNGPRAFVSTKKMLMIR